MVSHFINTQMPNVIIAGGMGFRAVDMFQSFGIEAETGVDRKVENILKAYLEEKVEGIVPCAHDHPHDEEHEGLPS
jgi:predicted Fe-Mo cluster-binding NifX family protein